jgi:hypothetical protein
MSVSASFGLAGCSALDDLKVSISQWFNTGTLTGEGEVPYVNAPEATRMIPMVRIAGLAQERLSQRMPEGVGSLFPIARRTAIDQRREKKLSTSFPNAT